MAALAWLADAPPLPSILAHGGTGGLIVELVVLLGIVALAAAVWTSSRRHGEEDDESREP